MARKGSVRTEKDMQKVTDFRPALLGPNKKKVLANKAVAARNGSLGLADTTDLIHWRLN